VVNSNILAESLFQDCGLLGVRVRIGMDFDLAVNCLTEYFESPAV
jgi:hypothetical protein